MAKLTTVIFDMDGLMVDSEPLARQAWDKVVNEFGIEMDDVSYRQFLGLRLEETSNLVRDVYTLPVSAKTLGEKKEAYLAEILEDGIEEMPGLFQLMGELERREIPWGVATSSRRAFATSVIDKFGLSRSCQAIAAGDEVVYGKPAPDVYLLAAERLSVEPEKCLAIEDSLPGCRAAIAAGMTTIAIPNVDTSGSDFSQVDYLFGSLEEVIPALDGIMTH